MEAYQKDESHLENKKKRLRQQVVITLASVVMLAFATVAWFVNSSGTSIDSLSFSAVDIRGKAFTIYKLTEQKTTASPPADTVTLDGRQYKWVDVKNVDFNLQVPNAVYRYKIVAQDSITTQEKWNLLLDINGVIGSSLKEPETSDFEVFKHIYIREIGLAGSNTSLLTKSTDIAGHENSTAGGIYNITATADSQGTLDKITGEITDVRFPITFTAIDSGGSSACFDIYLHKDASNGLRSLGAKGVLEIIK